ncbi:MAG: dihydrolipoamide acetyltransferase family protein, partial [Candidatus Poribacteria bacterium]|nr:dihydrolipoamide acetyltransferase family protein [Candidatus Poribacteria bacterium]
WLKQDGERVEAGEMLFVLEGEKASQEIESFDAGILRIPPDAPQPGDEVVVSQMLAYLVEEGETPPFELERAAKPAAPQPPRKEEPVTQAETPSPVPESKVPEPSSAPPSKRTAITPRARRVARELGVEWSGLRGTGVGGRIREADIRVAARASKAPVAVEVPATAVRGTTVPITRIRQTIAERMVAGVNEAAPVTISTKVDASGLVALRDRFKASDQYQFVPTYTDMVLKLTSIAAGEHPMITGQWCEDGIFIPEDVHIAFAVDTENGLLAPVIFDVPEKSLSKIAAESREIVDSARKGELKVDQLQNGVFTITNLGGYGVDSFTPIINLPQSAILGVGRIVREPVLLNGEVVPGETMSLSLTFDHRVIDGAPAARFLERVCQLLAEPVLSLIG